MHIDMVKCMHFWNKRRNSPSSRPNRNIFIICDKTQEQAQAQALALCAANQCQTRLFLYKRVFGSHFIFGPFHAKLIAKNTEQWNKMLTIIEQKDIDNTRQDKFLPHNSRARWSERFARFKCYQRKSLVVDVARQCFVL